MTLDSCSHSSVSTSQTSGECQAEQLVREGSKWKVEYNIPVETLNCLHMHSPVSTYSKADFVIKTTNTEHTWEKCYFGPKYHSSFNHSGKYNSPWRNRSIHSSFLSSAKAETSWSKRRCWNPNYFWQHANLWSMSSNVLNIIEIVTRSNKVWWISFQRSSGCWQVNTGWQQQKQLATAAEVSQIENRGWRLGWWMDFFFNLWCIVC